MSSCEHLDAAPNPDPEPAEACSDCVKEGLKSGPLRRCLTCGNLGCCDSSPGKHATAHFVKTQHPVMQASAHGSSWRWCYIHKIYG